MAYGTKYRLEFTNQIGEDYAILFNRKGYTGDTTDLLGAKAALNIKSLNSDDDPFAPILSKEAVITMFIPVEQNVSITDFLSTEDDDWNVVIYRDQNQPPIFSGFLVVEDSSQPLLDRPYELQLHASDGLPLLKDVPLKTAAGVNFAGFHSIVEYVTHALYYINPDINTRFYYNLFHVDMASNSPLAEIRLDAKTFEKDEVTFEDSYTALEKMMTDLQCRLFYENGYWHVVSIYQYSKDYGFNWAEYNIDGLVDSKTGDVLVAGIGKDEVIYPVNKDAVQYWKVATKSVKRSFNYDIPKEVICNQALTRGTRIPLRSGPKYDSNGHFSGYYEATTVQCWHYVKAFPIITGATPLDISFIRSETDVYGYEQNRYIVLPSEPGGLTTNVLFSEGFFVGNADKVTISVDTKVRDDYSGEQTALVFYVLLLADDGTYWILDDGGTDINGTQRPPGIWYQSNSSFSVNRKAIQHYFASGEGKDQWSTVSVESQPIPRTGTIQIALAYWSANNSANETWYKNIQIEYHPYIKDSFRPVKGDYNLYSQNKKIHKTIEETISISDSPKKIIKGSIFIGNNLASPVWHREGISETMRFSQLMALIKYIMFHRQYEKIEGTLRGLSLQAASGENMPFGFLPQYAFTDINEADTRYILTSMDVDYVAGTWRGVLVAVKLNPVVEFDKYDFNYVFE